jgi:hypothetical protein
VRALLGVQTAGVALLGGDRCFVQGASGRTRGARACWADTLPGWALLTPAGPAGVVTEAGAGGKRCGPRARPDRVAVQPAGVSSLGLARAPAGLAWGPVRQCARAAALADAMLVKAGACASMQAAVACWHIAQTT